VVCYIPGPTVWCSVAMTSTFGFFPKFSTPVENTVENSLPGWVWSEFLLILAFFCEAKAKLG